MKVANANSLRERYIKAVQDFFSDEDIGLITSNTVNFPVVENGEEGWMEITVKVVKDDEGYEKRAQYVDKCRDKAERAKAAAEKKAKKIAADQKRREEKKEASSL